MGNDNVKVNITWKDQAMVILLLFYMLPTFLKMGYEAAQEAKK